MEKDSLLGRSAVVVLAVAVLATLVDSAVARRTPRPEPRLLQVRAEAFEEAEPDVVRISLGLKAIRPTPREAAARVTRTEQAVRVRLARLGVTKEQIETSELYLGEATRWDMAGGRQISTGYKAYHWLRVTLKQGTFAKLGPVVAAAVAGGTTSLSGLTWEMEDDTDLRAAALQKATERARRKAEAMAGAAGTRLAGVQRLTDSYAWEDTDYGLEQYGYASAQSAQPAGPGAPAAAPAEAPAGVSPAAEPPLTATPSEATVPGKLRLHCTVRASFLIR